MNKVFPFLAGMTALMLMTACSKKKEAVKPATTVRVEAAHLTEGEGVLQYPGRVVNSNEANLSFRVAGQLKHVYVGEGDRVKAGQLIADLDDADYRIQLKATEAEYAQVKADAERVMALYKEEGTTASNYDKARYGLEQITAKLQNHKNQLAYTKLYAPCSGYVQTRFFANNETVAAGMPVVCLMGDGGLEVEINLPAAMYVKRDRLTGFECTFDVLPGETVPLQLISILPSANSNRLYTVRLRMPRETGKVAAGMSTWVKARLSGEGTDEVVVPATALLNKCGQTFVFLYNKEKQNVKKQTVEVVKLNSDGTAVISGSVADGDQVVTSGVHHITDGEKVELLAPMSKTNVGGLL